jgi:hypothetical protein
MSLDYPLYEEMRRRKCKGSFWWILGDRLYYIGLLPAMTLMPGLMIFEIVLRLLSKQYFAFGWLALCWVICALIFVLGASLKGYSYDLAIKDGIDPSKY